MLYFILIWAILMGSCLIFGTAILSFLQEDSLQKVGDRLMVSLWLGLVLFGVIFLGLSVFVPLSPWLGFFTVLITVILSLSPGKNRSQLKTFKAFLSPYLLIHFLTLALLIAALSTQPITWIDTGLYHVGVIRWLAEYGAVPGVSLIHFRLGWPSSWLALATPFSPGYFEFRTCALLNGFLLLIIGLHLGIVVRRIYRYQLHLSDYFLTLSLSIIVIFCSLPSLPIFNRKNLIAEIFISPSNDIPILVLISIISWLILVITENNNPRNEAKFKSDQIALIPFILSLGAVTIKLTALPLLGVTGLFYLTYRGFHWHKILWGSLATVVILTPMIIYSIMTTGCPLTPSTFMCLNLPWSPNLKQLQHITKSVGVSGWWKTWVFSDSQGKFDGLSLVRSWFGYNVSNLLVILSMIFSIIAIVWFLRKSYSKQNKAWLWVAMIGVTGVIFIVYQSPLFRFVLGYSLVIPCLLLSIYLEKVISLTPLSQRWRSLGDVIIREKGTKISFFVFGLIFILLVNFKQSSLLLPPKLIQYNLIKLQVNDIHYFYPFEKKLRVCWAAQLPCALGPIKENIKLRDPQQGIRGGFVYQ